MSQIILDYVYLENNSRVSKAIIIIRYQIFVKPKRQRTECLFCPHTSNAMEQNLTHMSMKHGFFIPDLDYLVDLRWRAYNSTWWTSATAEYSSKKTLLWIKWNFLTTPKVTHPFVLKTPQRW